MNLYEYQGREILKKFSIDIPDGIVVESPEKAVQAAKILFDKTNKKSLVIKAQIHAGGRGKSGGIQIVDNLDDVYKISNKILGKHLVTPQTTKKGILVNKILISENVYQTKNNKKYKKPNEYYLSIVLNREIGFNTIIYSQYGGIDIEYLSKNNPEKVFLEKIHPILGLQPFQIRKIGYNLNLNNNSLKNFNNFLIQLNKAYNFYDSTLIEINPFIKTLDDKIIPLDIKIVLDDNASFRQKKYHSRYNDCFNDPLEKEAIKYHLNFIKLKGNVGCMVNGAGLAMATMDMIKSCGGEPANFLDIGGSADEKRVEKAFSIILKDKSVKTILINIFGGIVRCDTVAEGIINSYSKMNDKITIPLVIRLKGTNEKKAKNILNNSLLPIYSTNNLEESSNKIREILS